MEYFLIAFVVTIGFLISTLSAAISSVPPDENDNDNIIKQNVENSVSPFDILEVFTYVVAAVMLGMSLSSGLHAQYESYVAVALFVISLLILRFVFFGIGIRFNNKLFNSFKPIYKFVNMLINPLASSLSHMIKSVSGEKSEDASRNEISALVESAREEGSLADREYNILKNIIHFSDVLVSDVMTPRTMVFAAKSDSTVKDLVKLPELKMYSRFPIWSGESLDENIDGYVMTRDVLHAALNGEMDIKLSKFAREVYYIPENAELDIALDKFLKRKQHLFMVVDEYGGIEGLLSMEDVLETILGAEIVDEADRFEDLRVIAKQQRDKRISQLSSSGEIINDEIAE